MMVCFIYIFLLFLAGWCERVLLNYTQDGSWVDFVLKWKLRRAALVGIGVSMLQQLTGTNAILYYGASLLPLQTVNTNGTDVAVATFGVLDGASASSRVSGQKPPQLIILGIVGVVNVVGTIVPLCLIDRVGRRLLLLSGSALMSLCFLGVAILLKMFGEQGSGGDTVVKNPNAHGFISILLIAFVFFFSASWAAGSWVLCAELFPTQYVCGASISLLFHWIV